MSVPTTVPATVSSLPFRSINPNVRQCVPTTSMRTDPFACSHVASTIMRCLNVADSPAHIEFDVVDTRSGLFERDNACETFAALAVTVDLDGPWRAAVDALQITGIELQIVRPIHGDWRSVAVYAVVTQRHVLESTHVIELTERDCLSDAHLHGLLRYKRAASNFIEFLVTGSN